MLLAAALAAFGVLVLRPGWQAAERVRAEGDRLRAALVDPPRLLPAAEPAIAAAGGRGVALLRSPGEPATVLAGLGDRIQGWTVAAILKPSSVSCATRSRAAPCGWPPNASGTVPACPVRGSAGNCPSVAHDRRT